MSECSLCPRNCRIDHSKTVGLCGCTDKITASKAYLHKWEEPCICTGNGAGAIFFSGCNLKCCYCQNFEISHKNKGKSISVERLANIFLELQEKGACNIDLVTPTPFVPQIINALDLTKHKLNIPIVYNCGGYELPDTIKLLDGYIDIYLPDFKYFSNDFALKYSKAPYYFEYASESIKEMIRQTGKLIFNEDNSTLLKGTIIRHLVIPNLRHDSIKLMEWISENLPTDHFLISLMSQYTPNGQLKDYPEINRKITKMEYNSVLKRAEELGLNGFSQDKSSADSSYTPDFDLVGI